MTAPLVALFTVLACLTTSSMSPPKKRVLLLGIDGLRGDALLAADAPNIHRLMADGSWTIDANASEFTVSGPGWSDVLTGVWPDKHRSFDNKFEGVRYDLYPHFFERLHEKNPHAVTASVVSWEPLDKNILGAFKADLRFSLDKKGEGDEAVVIEAQRALATLDPDAVFVYLGEVDYAGHDFGFHPSVPEYMSAIAKADQQVGIVLDALHKRPTYAQEDWLVVLVADHGGTLDKNHGRNEPEHRKFPFIVSGKNAAHGQMHTTVNQVDVPATLFAHLGISPDPAWGWDGRAVGFPIHTELDENLIFNGDAEASTGNDSAQTNAGVAGWCDLGDLTVVHYGARNDFPTADTPGPKDRGKNFFVGYKAKVATMTQTIDVEDIASKIDAGGLRYELAGWFGGFKEQRDMAALDARFLDERDGLLDKARAGPVTLEDRKREIGGENSSGLLPRSTTGDLPIGTRRIEVRLTCEIAEGESDAYADDLSLVFRAK